MTKARQIKNKGEADLFGQILLLEKQKKKGRERVRNANLQVVYLKRAEDKTISILEQQRQKDRQLREQTG